jgi:hypothetical protein
MFHNKSKGGINMQLSPEQIATLNEEIYSELLPTYLDLIDQHFKEINPDVSKLAKPGTEARQKQEQFILNVLKIADEEDVDPLLLLNLSATESTLGLDKGEIGNAFQIYESTWESAKSYFSLRKYLFEDEKLPDILTKTIDEINGNTENEVKAAIYVLRYSALNALHSAGMKDNRDVITGIYEHANKALKEPEKSDYDAILNLMIATYRNGAGNLYGSDVGKKFQKDIILSDPSLKGDVATVIKNINETVPKYSDMFKITTADNLETLNDYNTKVRPNVTEKELITTKEAEVTQTKTQEYIAKSEKLKLAEIPVEPETITPEAAETIYHPFQAPTNVQLTSSKDTLKEFYENLSKIQQPEVSMEAAKVEETIPESPKMPTSKDIFSKPLSIDLKAKPILFKDVVKEVYKEDLETIISQQPKLPSEAVDFLLLSAVEEPPQKEPTVIEVPTRRTPDYEQYEPEIWRLKIGTVKPLGVKKREKRKATKRTQLLEQKMYGGE